jgi:hypothetical protein
MSAIITDELVQVCTWGYEGNAARYAFEFDEITDEFTVEQNALHDTWNEWDRPSRGLGSGAGRKASGVREQLDELLETEFYQTALAWWRARETK